MYCTGTNYIRIIRGVLPQYTQCPQYLGGEMEDIVDKIGMEGMEDGW